MPKTGIIYLFKNFLYAHSKTCSRNMDMKVQKHRRKNQKGIRNEKSKK
jgi:hypothetical protein